MSRFSISRWWCVALVICMHLSVMDAHSAERPPISIIPKPLELELRDGTFTVSSTTVIFYDNSQPEGRRLAEYLAGLLYRATGYFLTINTAEPSHQTSQSIYLSFNTGDASLGAEGYTIDISSRSILMNAAEPAGLFHALQTFRQLLSPDIELTAGQISEADQALPGIFIRDIPRYPWRGFMLDVSRTFYNVDVLKQFIDVMALYKLNQLHLHLADDQGWRVEIPKYPRLTGIGAHFHPKYGDPEQFSGFYTRQELKDLVSYAEARYVTILPEIDMPGHAWGALVAYPELSVSGNPQPAEVFPYSSQRSIFEGHTIDTLDPTKEAVYTFIDDVLSELIEIFPSPYIHIGGDEVRFSVWEGRPHIQAFLKEHKLKDLHALQSYFIHRVNDIVRSKGRTMMGWNEITYGGLPEGAVVTAWQGADKVKLSTSLGARTVVGTNVPLYMNFWQDEAHTGMLGDRKQGTLRDVYTYTPEEGLTDKEQQLILGIQAAMWTHVARHLKDIQMAIFPRFLAVAEQGWTVRERKNFEDFTQRLQGQYKRLDNLGISYWKPPQQ